jgi:MFS family permease
VALATLAGGALLAAFAFVPTVALAYPLLALLGCSVILVAAGSNTLIQIAVAEEYRGRVMALFSTAFLGMAPIGSLTVGALVSVFGVRPVLCCCGLLAAGLGLRYRQQLGKLAAP